MSQRGTCRYFAVLADAAGNFDPDRSFSLAA